MARCKLKDLDGLPAFQSLQEFYLSFNEVEDVSVITMLSALDVLDLERWGEGGVMISLSCMSAYSNNLTDEDQLGYLALCPSLVSLTLEGNPLSIRLAETEVSLHSRWHSMSYCLSSIGWRIWLSSCNP